MADVAALVFDIDSSQARTAATDLAKLGDASVRASGGADKLNKTIRDSRGRFKSSFDVARQYGSEVQALAAKYNPALSAVYKYQQAQVELNRAVALGVLTQNQADAALTGVADGMRRAAASAQAYQSGMRGVNNIQSSVGNQFAQLNDVVVTAWGGMNPALIGMQQGMQMVQGFAGQSLPQALGTLRGAFAQLLNPTTLVTVAMVAGGSAAIQFGMSLFTAADEAEKVKTKADEFKETLDLVDSAIARVNAATINANRSLSEMSGIYGVMAESARAWSQLELQNAINSTTEAMNKQKLEFSALAQQYSTGTDMFGALARDLANIEKDFGLSADEAKLFRKELNDLQRAKTLEEQAEALDVIRKRLTDANGQIRQMPAAFASALAASAPLVAKAWELVSALNTAQGIGGASGVLGGRGGDPRQWTKDYDEATRQIQAQEAARLKAIEDARKAAERAASRGGGGSGISDRELKAAEKNFQSLRELMEKESLFQVAEWEKRQAQLDQALAKDLITRENYEIMKQQLQQMYFGSEYERDALNYQMKIEQLKEYLELDYITRQQYNARRAQTDWEFINQSLDLNSTAFGAQLNGMAGFMGNLNSLAGGGYEKLLKAQRIFAAASALISAWNGYAQTIGDPTVPAWMKIALAGKVLAAGLGAVAAIKGGGKGGSGSTGAASAAKAEPQRNVLVRLEGDDWLVSMADTIMTQIYDATGNGRVVVARDF